MVDTSKAEGWGGRYKKWRRVGVVDTSKAEGRGGRYKYGGVW